jgi:hypothetical protein
MGPTVAEYVADGNINLIWTSEADGFGRNFLDLAEQNGINGLWMDAAFNEGYELGDLNDPVKKAYIDDTIDDLNEMVSTGAKMVPKYPAFFGYYLYDEPTADKFAEIAEIRDYLRVRDPEHLAYVNISGLWHITSQQQVDDYQTYLNDYLSTVQPDLLSYDNYPFHNDFSGPGSSYVGKSDLNGYLANLGIISDTAQQAGIPFMNIVQAIRANAGWRNPDSNELRYQVYSTLAYGAQGISYYNWTANYSSMIPGPGEQFYNGDTTAGGLKPLPGDVPTATYTALTPLNAQFVEIASELQRVERIGTYLKGYAAGSGPPGPTLPPGGAPFSVSGVADSLVYTVYDSLQGVLLGFFGTDSASLASSTTTLVQNIDYTNSRAFTVHGPANLSLFDATTGVWTPMGQTSIALNLAPGDGVLVGITPGPDQTWDIEGSGDWNDAASWIGEINSNSVVPNSNTTIAILGSAITSPQTLFTDVPVTVKGFQFGVSDDGGAVQSYVISGQGSVNLDADVGNATIDVIDGSHQFQAVVYLDTATDVSIATGAVLSFNNVLNLNGFDLTKTGNGTMEINNALNTGGGVVSALAGVVSGSGMLLGDLENTGATLAPGDSPGQFTIQGDYTHGAGATLAIEIAGLIQAAEYDLLTVGGNLTLEGGELLVELLDGFDPSAGDVFDILDSSAIGGVGFDSLSLPALADGLVWDTSVFLTDGSLSVTAVPEPDMVVLFGIALLGLVGIRRPPLFRATVLLGTHTLTQEAVPVGYCRKELG